MTPPDLTFIRCTIGSTKVLLDAGRYDDVVLQLQKAIVQVQALRT